MVALVDQILFKRLQPRRYILKRQRRIGPALETNHSGYKEMKYTYMNE